MSALSITINNPGLQIVPGSAGTFSVEVRNLGSVVDRYRCEILGLDPLYLANEGKIVAVVPAEQVGDALASIPQMRNGYDALLVPHRWHDGEQKPWQPRPPQPLARRPTHQGGGPAVAPPRARLRHSDAPGL